MARKGIIRLNQGRFARERGAKLMTTAQRLAMSGSRLRRRI